MASAGIGFLKPANLPPVSAQSFFTSHALPIGIQLFPLAERLRDNLIGTLKQVAAIGYSRVELAGLLGYSARQFREALDTAGLKCESMHVPAQAVFGPSPTLDGNLDRVAADAHVLGARDIVMPLFLMPIGFERAPATDTIEFLRRAGKALTATNYLEMARFLNEKALALKARGLRLSYHNHNFEFAPLKDSCGLEMLLHHTDPDLVEFELDAGWAASARVDIAALLCAHRDRFTKMHVKDILPSTPLNYAMEQQPVSLGAGGVIDWPRVLPIAYSSGVRSFYVEQEAPFAGDRIEAMTANYHYLATIEAIR